jgi:hypothetical protein
MVVEKDNSPSGVALPPQEAQGASSASSGSPQGLNEVIQQKSSCIALKEFQRHGIKELKVITQRGLEELINLAVEGELAARLDKENEKEREARTALEEEVSRLRRELEALRGAGGAGSRGLREDWQWRLKEIVSEAVGRAKEGLGEKDVPIEFLRSLEEYLLRGLESGLGSYSHGAPADGPKVEQERKSAGKGGGFFERIIKENLQLRGG